MSRTLQFEMCSCGRHGRFHDGNGACGPEVADRRTAKAFLDRAHDPKRTKTDGVPTDVAARLFMQIEKSSLPKTPSKADRAVLDAVVQWGVMVAATNRPEKLWEDGRKGCLIEKFFPQTPI